MHSVAATFNPHRGFVDQMWGQALASGDLKGGDFTPLIPDVWKSGGVERDRLITWLQQVATKYPETASSINELQRHLDAGKGMLFRRELVFLLQSLQKQGKERIKGLYYKELLEQIQRFPHEDAPSLLCELLKAQESYEVLDGRLAVLCASLHEEIAKEDRDLALTAEKCKSAYRSVAALLGERTQVRVASETAYAEVYGRLRGRFRALDVALRRRGGDHLLCNCHYQKELPLWPGAVAKIVNLTDQPSAPLGDKRPISALIATCGYGSGHRCLAGAIGGYCKKAGMDVNVVDLPSQVLHSTDPVYSLTARWPLEAIFGRCTKADFYNWLVKHNYWGMIRFLKRVTAGEPTEVSTQEEEDLIRRRVLMENPDVLIMTYTIHEKGLLRVAEELGLPLLSVSPDLHISSNWKSAPSYPHYRLAAPVAFPGIEKCLAGKLRADQVQVIGAGFVDPAMLKVRIPEEIATLKKTMGIAPGKKVVMLMNGGCGCRSPYPEMLAKHFAKEEGDIHLIVICGQNESFRTDLETRVRPRTKMSMDVRGYVRKRSEMSDIYDVADLIVTKPGGGTVMEAGRKGVKMLFDDTLGTDLPWERTNMEATRGFGMAMTFTRREEFYGTLRQLLNAPSPFRNPFQENDPEKALVQMAEQMVRSAKAEVLK